MKTMWIWQRKYLGNMVNDEVSRQTIGLKSIPLDLKLLLKTIL